MPDDIGPDDGGQDWTPQAVPATGRKPDASDPLTLALAIQGTRRRRRAMFPHAERIFHEPAWDVLLDLFVADAQGRVADFGDLCDTANVRAQTAIRWITTLETLGLVEATAMPGARMPHLTLTEGGREAMIAYLADG